MNQRPFSQACENNKQPILAELREEFAAVEGVLELASGTGQHACYFAAALPVSRWQMTDLAENLSGLEAWRADYSGSNLPPALALDVCQAEWGVEIPDAIFTANSLHIMPWLAVERLFDYLGKHAPIRNRLCIYGPFNYGGEYTSDSNARFDEWLAQRNAGSAIRDFEAVDALAAAAGYRLQADHAMPANNRLLVWHRLSAVSCPA
jgi:hypothetical protein